MDRCVNCWFFGLQLQLYLFLFQELLQMLSHLHFISFCMWNHSVDCSEVPFIKSPFYSVVSSRCLLVWGCLFNVIDKIVSEKAQNTFSLDKIYIFVCKTLPYRGNFTWITEKMVINMCKCRDRVLDSRSIVLV